MMAQSRRAPTKRRIQDISGLEGTLQGLFNPVRPRQVFIRDLHERLMHSPTPRGHLISWLELALLAGIGLLSGIVLVIAGIKAIVAVVRYKQVARPQMQ